MFHFQLQIRKILWKLLKRNNIFFKERYIPEINIEQLFFKDPAGNGIELIFLDKSLKRG